MDLVGSNNYSQNISLRDSTCCALRSTQLASCKLEDGNIFIGIASSTDTDSRGVSGIIIDPSTGDTVVPEFPIYTDEPAYSYFNGACCTTLSGGNIFFGYGVNNTNVGQYTILSPSGSIVVSAGIFAAPPGSAEIHNPVATTLTNGRVVIVYQNEDDNDIQFSLYNPVTDTVISSLNSISAIFGDINDVANGNAAIPLSAGNFALLYFEENGGGENKVMLKKFDSNGALIKGITVDDPPFSDPGSDNPYGHWSGATMWKMDTGDLGIYGKSFGSQWHYHWLYDQNLNVIQSRTKDFDSGVSTWITMRSAAFGNNKYGIIDGRQAPGDSSIRVHLTILEPM